MCLESKEGDINAREVVLYTHLEALWAVGVPSVVCPKVWNRMARLIVAKVESILGRFS